MGQLPKQTTPRPTLLSPEFRIRATEPTIIRRHHQRIPTYRPARVALSNPCRHHALLPMTRAKMSRITNPCQSALRRRFGLRRQRSVNLIVQPSERLTYPLPRSQSLLTAIQKTRPLLENDTEQQQGTERSPVSRKWTQSSMPFTRTLSLS